DNFEEKDRCIHGHGHQRGLSDRSQVVGEHAEVLPIPPLAPRVPFEVWVLPKRHTSYFEGSQKFQFEALARIFSDTLRRLDRVLGTPPFNFILHTSPLHERTGEVYHWHIEVVLKLTQVSGCEWGTGL